MMESSHDPRHDIAYIRLRANAGDTETLRLSDSVHIDLGPDGTVVGIELMNANAQLDMQDGTPSVVFVDEAGARREMKLSA